MDFFTFAIEMIKLLLDPLSRQLNYVRKFRKNMTELQGEREKLNNLEDDVSKEIARAKLQRKDTKNEVQNWLKRVAEVKEEISDIEKECEENKRCFKNCMPNYCLRGKVGKRSLELIGELEKLKKECSFEGGVAVDSLPVTTRTFCTAPIFGKDVIEKYMRRIWECLVDANIGKIGVHGMGGVGKTMIITHINNRLKDAKIFESIIWVTVSKELSLRRLQSDVAKAIQLDLSDDHDEKIRSGELFEALSKKKKFVLLLDDLWEAFSLDDIGIPEPKKENGAKMVLTTRLLNVCDGMETQKNIKVDALPKGYAWDLFSNKVEKDVLTKPEIENVAKLVAEECKGLPLALITVGRALRNANDVRLWRNALNELRGSTHNIRGMEDDVFKRLKFSYTRLTDDNVRACFLYCSLYPEDWKISVNILITSWMWDGLINEDGDKEVVMDKGYAILNELICACMLERVSSKTVKMHDLIRDMAIGITKDSPRFMVKTCIGLKEQPKDEEFVEDIKRISLSWNSIASLTGQPNCPKLRTLILTGNYQLSAISRSFFLYMHSLRVLDLSYTDVDELPESLSGLVNLRALFLHCCWRLVVLPSLVELKELRILDLRETAIRELPPGMEGLINLRYLDLSFTDGLETVREGIIPQLSVLEELSLLRLEDSWKIDMSNKEGETLIKEIFGLKRLDTLATDFEDIQSLLIYLESAQWRSLCYYGFCFGRTKASDDAFCHNGWVKMRTNDTNRCSVLGITNSFFETKKCWGNLVIPQVLLDSTDLRTYRIKDCECTKYIFKGEKDLSLSTVESLKLQMLSSLRAISKGVMPCGALANLKKLKICSCDSLQHVFSVSLLKSFQTLEIIEVENCVGMEEIIPPSKGEHQGVLPSLRILKIDSCYELKTLFSSDLLQSLQNIEHIEISSCFNMKQMVVEEADGEDISEMKNITRNAISLPRLRELNLKYVYNLKSISERMLICNSLQQIQLSKCPYMSSLPLSIGNQTATLDGWIEGSRDWWNALYWEDPNTKTILESLFKTKTILELLFNEE